MAGERNLGRGRSRTIRTTVGYPTRDFKELYPNPYLWDIVDRGERFGKSGKPAGRVRRAPKKAAPKTANTARTTRTTRGTGIGARGNSGGGGVRGRRGGGPTWKGR